MNAQDIIKLIGEGVAEALNTNRIFLGVEGDKFKNADIHPEYVTTLEVAKKLASVDRIISLEMHMKELRQDAGSLALVAWGRKENDWETIKAVLKDYQFGKKDSQRLDIVVRPSDTLLPPLLIAEVKLGSRKHKSIVKDVCRIFKLLEIYKKLRLLEERSLYGAVVFHHMVEGNDTGAFHQKAKQPQNEIERHLCGLRAKYPWLNARSGLLTVGNKNQPVTAYTETYEDGSEYDTFAKNGFTFAPGLVLLGNAADVNDMTF